jgi:hypothetical protein
MNLEATYLSIFRTLQEWTKRSRADIYFPNSICVKLLKYYLISGTLKHQMMAVIVKVLLFSNIYIPA